MTADRVALVTGGASGIGAACVEALLATNACVVVADLAGATSAREPVVDARIVSLAMDVTDEDQVAAGFAAAARRGRLRTVVVSAGVGGPSVPVGEHPLDAWQRVIDVQLTGAFLSVREAVRTMSGGGSIVLVSSVFGSAAAAHAPAYTAAKHATEGLTKTAALAYADFGIRVNSVAPGFIDTDMLRSRRDVDVQEALAARHPLGRLGTAEEVAQVVAFLASDAASFVTGSCYRVDGGFLTQG